MTLEDIGMRIYLGRHGKGLKMAQSEKVVVEADNENPRDDIWTYMDYDSIVVEDSEAKRFIVAMGFRSVWGELGIITFSRPMDALTTVSISAMRRGWNYPEIPWKVNKIILGRGVLMTFKQEESMCYRMFGFTAENHQTDKSGYYDAEGQKIELFQRPQYW